MGYKIIPNSIENDFFIDNDRKEECYISIRNYCLKNHLEWVRKENIEKAQTLEELLIELRWKPILNKKGDIVSLDFVGENIGDERTIFNKLAKFSNDSTIAYVNYIDHGVRKTIHRIKNGKCTTSFKNSNAVVNTLNFYTGNDIVPSLYYDYDRESLIAATTLKDAKEHAIKNGIENPYIEATAFIGDFSNSILIDNNEIKICKMNDKEIKLITDSAKAYIIQFLIDNKENN